MSAHRTTRRSLLAAGAGVIAAGMARPGSVLAALTHPPSARTRLHPSLREQWLGRVAATGSTGLTVKLARPADLIGLRWQGPARADVELRFRAEDGSWSRWAAAGAHGHGPDGGAETGSSPTAG